MEGGVSWDAGDYFPPARTERDEDDDDALELDVDALVDDDDALDAELAGETELDFAQLRELWRSLPEPPWDDDRAQRIFDGIMERIGMRRRRRLWLAVGAAVALPFGLLVTSRLAR